MSTRTQPLIQNRSAGVLLHPSSLPGDSGIGTIGSEARSFIDVLTQCGFQWWQFLPLVPSSKHGNPYSSWSSFAANPLLIDLLELYEAGLLASAPSPRPFKDKIDFEAVEQWKYPLLQEAARTFQKAAQHPWRAAYDQFRSQTDWLDTAALFYVLRESQDQKPWWQWPKLLAQRQAATIEKAIQEHETAIEQFCILQFFFERQWAALRAYAHAKNVKFIGDVPIYVDHDSADVWANQALFQLDAGGLPTHVSGAPPDAYSDLGQLWENPLYRWDEMQRDGYSWWVQRISRALSQADLVRLDHFRGFVAYWAVPYGQSNAVKGEWEPGPGHAFFDVLQTHWPALPFIAEDLGLITEDVYRLRDAFGLPGMRVLQFGFDGQANNVHAPDQELAHSLVYTGTHDSDTTLGWWTNADDQTKKSVRRHFTSENQALVWDLIENAFASNSMIAIIPAQDLLGLCSKARMNTPGTTNGNWAWRMAQRDELLNLRMRVRGLLEAPRPYKTK